MSILYLCKNVPWAHLSAIKALGVSEFPESDATYERWKNLIDFARRYNGKCKAEDVQQFISDCDEGNPGSINRHNKASVCLTFSNPQNEPRTLWVMQPYINDKFEKFSVP